MKKENQGGFLEYDRFVKQTEQEVKGSTIRSKLAFTRERFGEEAEQDLKKRLGAAGYTRVLEGSWYPFSLYEQLLHRIAERHFAGDLSRLFEVGAFSARQALTTTYDVFAGRRDFSQFLQRISALHGRFYRVGEILVELSRTPDTCAIRMRGAAPYSQADLHVAAGFYAGSAHLMGLENARCHFESAGEEVHFRIAWGQPDQP